jgi:hypothetical protein
VIANRVLPAMFNRREQAIVDRLDEAMALLIDAVGRGAQTVVDAARLTESRRSTGATHLDRLRRWIEDTETIDHDLPIITVPELFARAAGPRVVSLVADALTDELDPDPMPAKRQGKQRSANGRSER